jgi:uncharacterized membrane protein
MATAAPRAHRGAFGDDAFGRFAEKTARFFGTPQYILGQTFVVIVWVLFNGFELFVHFDKYPFILLNLLFSTQAAYAAPLILLAQTRQAERDKAQADESDKRHTQLERAAAQRTQAIKSETDKLTDLMTSNTTLTQQDKDLTEQVHKLTTEIHRLLTQRAGG